MQFHFGDDLSHAERVGLARAFAQLAATQEWGLLVSLLQDFRVSAALRSLTDDPAMVPWWRGYVAAVEDILSAPDRMVAQGRAASEILKAENERKAPV